MFIQSVLRRKAKNFRTSSTGENIENVHMNIGPFTIKKLTTAHASKKFKFD